MKLIFTEVFFSIVVIVVIMVVMVMVMAMVVVVVAAMAVTSVTATTVMMVMMVLVIAVMIVGDCIIKNDILYLMFTGWTKTTFCFVISQAKLRKPSFISRLPMNASRFVLYSVIAHQGVML